MTTVVATVATRLNARVLSRMERCRWGEANREVGDGDAGKAPMELKIRRLKRIFGGADEAEANP